MQPTKDKGLQMLRSNPYFFSDYCFVFQPHGIVPLSPFCFTQDVEFPLSDFLISLGRGWEMLWQYSYKKLLFTVLRGGAGSGSGPGLLACAIRPTCWVGAGSLSSNRVGEAGVTWPWVPVVPVEAHVQWVTPHCTRGGLAGDPGG